MFTIVFDQLSMMNKHLWLRMVSGSMSYVTVLAAKNCTALLGKELDIFVLVLVLVLDGLTVFGFSIAVVEA